MACQTCHIPTFARTLPTKVWWDWSTAGKDVKEIPKDQWGQVLYDKMKGDFKWDKDVAPTYMWFNGSVERHLLGEKFDPSKTPIHHNYPMGKKGEKNAKIWPFKIMKGKQMYDPDKQHLYRSTTFRGILEALELEPGDGRRNEGGGPPLQRQV